jgi:FdhD protein
MESAVSHIFASIAASGIPAMARERDLAVEAPVAIEINGIGYAVLMATPSDLDDLLFGFLLSERLIDGGADLLDHDIYEAPVGIIIRATVSPHAFEHIAQRVRHRASDTSCGLCGIENLEQALRPFPHKVPAWRGQDSAVFAALSHLPGHQTLNARTGAVHGAALCAADGAILEMREDVGRHNAFDKLIGAMTRQGRSWGDGFALLTSRCSYELVEKAVLSRCPMLATISAPTELAVQRAAEAGLALRVLARPDALLASPP